MRLPSSLVSTGLCRYGAARGAHVRSERSERSFRHRQVPPGSCGAPASTSPAPQNVVLLCEALALLPELRRYLRCGAAVRRRARAVLPRPRSALRRTQGPSWLRRQRLASFCGTPLRQSSARTRRLGHAQRRAAAQGPSWLRRQRLASFCGTPLPQSSARSSHCGSSSAAWMGQGCSRSQSCGALGGGASLEARSLGSQRPRLRASFSRQVAGAPLGRVGKLPWIYMAGKLLLAPGFSRLQEKF
jgi:hypothetical protein